MRQLLETVTGDKKEKLEAQCDALVQLAEPGDAFSAFTASMNASAIASHVKSIESTLGLKVCPLYHDMETAVTKCFWLATK